MGLRWVLTITLLCGVWCPSILLAESISYQLKVLQEAKANASQDRIPGFPEAFTLTDDGKIVGTQQNIVRNGMLPVSTPQKTVNISMAGAAGIEGHNVPYAANDRGEVFLVMNRQVVSPDQGGKLITVVGPGHLIEGKPLIGAHNPIAANNKGQLAFLAALEGGGGLCTLEKCIAKVGDTLDNLRIENFGTVSLTDGGDVIFSAIVSSGGEAIFKNDHVLVKAGDVIGGKTLKQINGQFVASPQGHILFSASTDDVPAGCLFTLDGLVAQNGDVINGWPIRMWQNLKINNRGDVAFLGIDMGSSETYSYAIVLATPAGSSASPATPTTSATKTAGGRSKMMPVLILGGIVVAILFLWPKKQARR